MSCVPSCVPCPPRPRATPGPPSVPGQPEPLELGGTLGVGWASFVVWLFWNITKSIRNSELKLYGYIYIYICIYIYTYIYIYIYSTRHKKIAIQIIWKRPAQHTIPKYFVSRIRRGRAQSFLIIVFRRSAQSAMCVLIMCSFAQVRHTIFGADFPHMCFRVLRHLRRHAVLV